MRKLHALLSSLGKVIERSSPSAARANRDICMRRQFHRRRHFHFCQRPLQPELWSATAALCCAVGDAEVAAAAASARCPLYRLLRGAATLLLLMFTQQWQSGGEEGRIPRARRPNDRLGSASCCLQPKHARHPPVVTVDPDTRLRDDRSTKVRRSVENMR